MSKPDWKDAEIKRLRLLQPLEQRILRRHFPNLFDRLLPELWDLVEASDPLTSKEIGGGVRYSKSGVKDGTESRGGSVALRGGHDAAKFRRRIETVDRRLKYVAEDVFDGMDRPPAGYRPPKRRCWRDKCADVNRRQNGFLQDGVLVCRTCSHPLTERKTA